MNTNTQSEIRTTPHNVVCVPARAAVLQCCSAAGESGEVGWRVSLTSGLQQDKASAALAGNHDG